MNANGYSPTHLHILCLVSAGRFFVSGTDLDPAVKSDDQPDKRMDGVFQMVQQRMVKWSGLSIDVR